MIKELTGNNKVYFDLCFGNDKLISENILGNYIKAFPIIIMKNLKGLHSKQK